MKKDRFNLIHFFTFEEEEPRASWSAWVKALEIFESSRGGEKFVIVEYLYSFANYARFTCHFYATEEAMREAFKTGLRLHLSAQKGEPDVETRTVEEAFKQMFESRPPSAYANHDGFLRTREYEDFETPWFLAKEGEEVDGDFALKTNVAVAN